MAIKPLRIYLSSTFEDLKEHRAAVFEALEKGGLQVARMEAYTASDDRPVDLCLRDVAQSDLYVGLFAWRYGYPRLASTAIPTGGRSPSSSTGMPQGWASRCSPFSPIRAPKPSGRSAFGTRRPARPAPARASRH